MTTAATSAPPDPHASRHLLPATFRWLADVPGLPLMVRHALPLYGTHEAPGRADNPVIIAWARETGLEKTYHHDETAWCGLFMALVAKRSGKPYPAQPLWALNWRTVGTASREPSIGDVLVFRRLGGGHVGLYVGEDEAAYYVLGGNSADAVTIIRKDRAQLVAARQPHYGIGRPTGAIPMHLAPTGQPLSRNEA